MNGILGNPIFLRETRAVARRPRTYVLQTVFLAALAGLLLVLWPRGGQDGSAVSDAGRLIFEYGTYLEAFLIALLAPTATAGAITVEKSRNTLGLLLLTDAGPMSIVMGKLAARTAALAFLLLLSAPVVFAVLTLGGVDARAIGAAFVLLLSLAWLGGAVGIFFSTIFKNTPAALMGGYISMGASLALPDLLVLGGAFARVGAGGAGTIDARAPLLSPIYAVMSLFEPAKFVASESFPTSWWVNPTINVLAGTALALAAGRLLPIAKDIERAFDPRRALEGLDGVLARLMPAALVRRFGDARPGPAGNPIYWKETTVNTLGRFRHWWRVNLLITLLLLASYWAFRSKLHLVDFHKHACAALTTVLTLAATVISANAVAKEREDRTLEVLATTPIDCATYVQGKVAGILRNIVFLVLLPIFHVIAFTAAGTINASSLALAIALPVATTAAIQQGILVSLVFKTTLRAVLAAVVLVVAEGALPFCCCLPSFNLPLLGYYAIAAADRELEWALVAGTVFSTLAQLGFMVVTYSIIRSGFDRYIGRAS